MALADNFKGLPMGELIGGPLRASCAAQIELSQAMINSMLAIGFDGSGNSRKTRTLDMTLDRPVVNQDTGTISTETISVKAPVLGLVPVPALLIDLVTVNFSMEVKTVETSKETLDTSVEVDASAKYLWFKASIKGKVATHKENTRESDKSAKYDVHVEAKQQPATEGMGKLMDLLATAVEPLTISSGGGGGA